MQRKHLCWNESFTSSRHTVWTTDNLCLQVLLCFECFDRLQVQVILLTNPRDGVVSLPAVGVLCAMLVGGWCSPLVACGSKLLWRPLSAAASDPELVALCNSFPALLGRRTGQPEDLFHVHTAALGEYTLWEYYGHSLG